MANIILDYYKGIDLYSDGDIEDTILNLVKSHDDNLIQKSIEESNDFAILYHLSKARGNIISVCDIKKSDVCLEIGAGCGAISEAILTKTEHLDAIELSKRRSEINAERNKNHKDFNIIVGNFTDIDINLDKKYDKIFLIGVLEYSSLYVNSNNPFTDLLFRVRNLLKEDGSIFIAIENKYGMKYFNGAREDHTGNFFESITGYYNKTAKTFSNLELRDMFKTVGLNNVYFYYPLPDYKFPNVIYSEDYLPDSSSIYNIGHSLDRDRAVLFNEDLALYEAKCAKHFETFTNSFLIKVGK